jgi:hypothetical protein
MFIERISLKMTSYSKATISVCMARSPSHAAIECCWRAVDAAIQRDFDGERLDFQQIAVDSYAYSESASESSQATITA